MKEKTKKYLIITAYKAAFALGIFIIIFIINLFAPAFTEKISPIWTKNTNFQKLGSLLMSVLKETFPF